MKEWRSDLCHSAPHNTRYLYSAVFVLCLVAILGIGGWACLKQLSLCQALAQQQCELVISERIQKIDATQGVIEQACFSGTNAEKATADDLSALQQMKEAVISSLDEQKSALSSLQGCGARKDVLGTVPETVSETVPQTDPLITHYQTILEHLDEYEPFLITFLMRDSSRVDFVLDWPNRAQYQQPPATITASLETFPLIVQWEKAWGYLPYGGGEMYQNGCAPTALSMVFSYLKQDASLTPWTIASYAQANGYWIENEGTAWSFMEEAANHFGLQSTRISPTQEALTQNLLAGKPVIASMRPGDFTTLGHFVVLVGMQDGSVLVHDPNSYKNSTLWDMDRLLQQSAALWAFLSVS